MIHEPLIPNAVFVTWRDPKEHRCYPVARLARVPNGEIISGDVPRPAFEFAYVKGVKEAQGSGFTRIESFSDLHRVYRGRELFPFFANRIMSDSRPEWAAYLGRLDLQHSDPLEILSRTGGIRATDSYEVFPLPRIAIDIPGFRTFFLVHALRHFPKCTQERIAKLAPGDRLLLMQDIQNPYDPCAMALRTEDRVLVGHIPNYLLLEVFALAEQCSLIDFTVAKVNPSPAPLDQRLVCEMETCWPDNYKPFVADRFQPISDDAVTSQVLIGDYLGDISYATH
jgi:hypothetical protein